MSRRPTHTYAHGNTEKEKKNAAERAVKLREDEIITHTELPSDPFWQQSTGSLHADVQTFSKPGSALTFAVWGRHTQTVRGWRKKREKDLLTDNGEGTHQESPPQRSETLLWATMSQKQKKKSLYKTWHMWLTYQRLGDNPTCTHTTASMRTFVYTHLKACNHAHAYTQLNRHTHTHDHS